MALPSSHEQETTSTPTTTTATTAITSSTTSITQSKPERNDGAGAPEPPFSIFSTVEKKMYAWIASVGAFSSPVSSSIYYPALNVLATDLHTTPTKINLTITTFMIFQAVAPTFTGGFSERFGRRPAYLVCFILFISANIGLALQTSFAALLVLRCLQSSGGSGTATLSNGVVSDVATRAERGSYIGLAALGSSLGPALGPVIGGMLTQFLGWRAIFWFLSIYAGVMLLIFALFVPETCRNIVGNGSVPPQRWNVSLMGYLHRRKQRKNQIEISHETIQKKRRPGIMSSIPILLQRETFLLMFFGGILYAGYYIVLTGLPSQLAETYHYNSIQVGLCYMPMGAGAIVSRSMIGRAIDWNFRRQARLAGLEIVKSRQPNIDDFPIERTRLEIGLPLVYAACVMMVPYGWVMSLSHPPLPAALVLLFFTTFFLSGSFQSVNVLIMDINPQSPASASAAFNLVRCLLGAGGVAAVAPLLNKIGRGWTSTLIALVWLLLSSFWWATIVWGRRWRKESQEKEALREGEEGSAKEREKGT